MKRSLILLFVVLLVVGAVQAAIETYELTWYTIDAGGSTTQAESYTLSSTIGQPDAGSLAGGDYSLYGGFWSEATPARVYLPMVIH